MRNSLRPWRTVLAAVLLGLAGGTVRADLLFLKDGFVLQGKVRRESVTEFDPVSKDMMIIPKGFFLLDDGPRRVYFSPAQVRIVERMPNPPEERFRNGTVYWILHAPGVSTTPPPIIGDIEAGPWNERWQRSYSYSGPTRQVNMTQQIAMISPHFIQVDSIKQYRWSGAYLTSEFPPDVIYKLLTHPPPAPKIIGARKKKEKETPDALAARRFRLCDFLVQAGWYDLTRRELIQLAEDFPKQKKRVASARLSLARLVARERFEQIKRWHHAGRHEAVRKALADFAARDVPESILADLRERRAEYARTDARLKDAARYLTDCARGVKEPKHKPLVAAAAVIRGDLHPSNVDRLDAFLGQARQAERQRARKREAELSPAQLLSLAVSGWLLGSPSAEARPDAALSLWRTRRLVLDYLKESSETDRRALLAAYLKNTSPRVELDEVAQLIPNLPPIEPARVTSARPTEEQAGRGRRRTTYHLQLPPEYTHSRPYPVLLVLHRAGEKAKTMLARWSAAAAEHGYILAAPEWERGGGSYQFSEAEHDKVRDTLQDLRRRFRIDSDRVFLFGLAEGGLMALDVGLAHPDWFAGVLPMGAGPALFPARYWRNAQYLPLYVVCGNRAGAANALLRQQFDHWILRGYPALWVEYKGRGVEWFSGEVPSMFDWMGRQRRDFPLRQLGSDGGGGSFGNEFCTMRPEDNHFYWLSTSEILPRFTTTARRWSNFVQPATLTGRIDPSSNEIFLKTTGLRQVTVWLGRSSRGQYMVDLDKPLTIRAGFRAVWVNRRVTPSLRVLLEDLYERGDRQQLFMARVDLRP
jgi:hypothetical protein